MNKVISPPDLYTLICSPNPVLVFDIRDKQEYKKERICFSIHLDTEQFPTVSSIATEVFRMQINTRAITPASHKNLFLNRENYDVIIVDEDGADKANIRAQLSPKARLLVGGYKMFCTFYPSLCTGSPLQDEYLINKCEKERSKHEPIAILPYLFCGDSSSAQNCWVTDVLGIEHMINAYVESPNYNPRAYTYLQCGLPELPFGDLCALFNRVYNFIETARSRGSKVLIYSNTHQDGLAGMVACAYLIRKEEWPLERAFLTLKKHIPSFAPNVAILARLGEYEVSLFGTTYVNPFPTDIASNDSSSSIRSVSGELRYVRSRQKEKMEEEALENEGDGELEEELLEQNLC